MTTHNLVLIAVFATCLAASLASYCGPPDSPDHGGFNPYRRFYSVGKRVNFFCKKGYVLVGQKYTVCTYSRNTRKVDWAHSSPVCKPINCPPLDDPKYGFVEVTGNKPGDKATYTCDYGFELSGNSQRVCQASGEWSGSDPTCEPITCPDLPDPKYGSVELTGNRVGAYANYECDFGFRLSGDSQLVCLSSGEWSGEPPTCVAITCPDLEAPQYGSVTLSGNRVGDEAEYECDEGFELDGDSPRECLESGDWGGEAPSCVPILCPDLEDPVYGTVETTDNRVGDVANYECDYGFSLEGDSQRTCTASGDWSGEAPTCVAITCPDLDDPKYGSVDVTGNRVGYEANYECDEGFRLTGDRQRECLISGEWSGEEPTCVPITCPSLQDPRYGSVSLTGNRVGDYANYQCDAGFTLEGDARRKCQVSGQWSGEVPSCVPVKCPDLDDPAYGSVKLSGNKVGDTATYRCKYGFRLVGVYKRTCQASGDWSGEAPVCKRLVSCGKPRAPRYGYVRYSSTGGGARAYYSCHKGYNLRGNDYRVCQPNSYWSGSVPHCVHYY